MPGLRRGVARTLAGALAVALGTSLLVYLLSERALSRRYVAPTGRDARLDVAIDSALIERGRHLVTEVAQCTYCHGTDLGGREMADDPWIGRLFASNLTTGVGGVGARLGDGDWIAALRHGLNAEGHSLLLMPSAELARLSDRDLAAVIAFLKHVPPVDRVLPERRAGWLTRVVVAAGLAPDLISADQVARIAPASNEIPPGLTPEYGEYLVALGGCRVCHRADLRGGLHPLSLPGEPVPPDLTRSGPIADWTRGDFARAMQSGATPDGRVLDRAFMPWPAFAGLDELELDAIWLYLRTLREPGEGKGSGGTAVAVSGETRSQG